MTSIKQIEANRNNAKKSTGPISNSGKAIVAKNAVRHGILSTHVFIEDNERELYEGFREDMLKSFSPKSIFENFLIDRIITTAWRLRRIIHIEALIFDKANKFSFNDSYSDVFITNSAGNMTILSRYERSLENALYRELKELKLLQEEENQFEILESVN